MMRLAMLAQACGGVLRGEDTPLQGVTTDTRGDCDNRLFVALKGENFDAHDFVKKAASNGASALMVEREVDVELPVVLVDCCYKALQQISAWWRSQFVVPVVGITGSVGKTTVKEMTAEVFKSLGKGLVTQGNLNNEIGVPLTLLRFTSEDRYAVIEMGMNQAGEIGRLTELAKPTIALVNNAAAAHLEGLGTVAAVAEAKGEIFQGLPADGVAIVNVDDRHAQYWLDLVAGKQVLTFGLDHEADVTARCELFSDHSKIQVEHGGEVFTVNLAVPGKHNVNNALACIAIARAGNVPVQHIIDGLERYRPIAGRLNFNQAGNLLVIDDTYNANPASMAAAIDVLARYEHTTLIVGDMAELGSVALQEHQRLGRLAADKSIARLMAVGEFAMSVVEGFGADGQAFATQEELLGHLASYPVITGNVLVKGSRSARMEQVVEHLLAANESQSQLNLLGRG